MANRLKKGHFLVAAAFVVGALCISSERASAHVVVKPGEVTTATHQVFTVSVPNEKEIPTVAVRLVIPDKIDTITPTVKAGWSASFEYDEGSQATTMTAITWSGGEIPEGFRDEFTFSAKTPSEATELQWKAYQTYSDGTVVAWNQEESSDGHDTESGPLSVTSVIADTEGENGVTDNHLAAAQADARRALYVAIAGGIVGLVAVFLATRKRK